MKENHYGMVEGGDKKKRLVGAQRVFFICDYGQFKKTQTMNALCYIRIIN